MTVSSKRKIEDELLDRVLELAFEEEIAERQERQEQETEEQEQEDSED